LDVETRSGDGFSSQQATEMSSQRINPDASGAARQWARLLPAHDIMRPQPECAETKIRIHPKEQL